MVRSFESGPPPLFNQGVSARARLAFFSFLAIALIIIDSRIKALETVRVGAGVVLYPLQQALLVPGRVADAVVDYFTSVTTLQRENDALKRRQIESAQTLLQAEQIGRENERLRKLLGARERAGNSAILGTVLYESRDRFSHKIVLHIGTDDAVRAGNPVIDDVGVVGQVTRAFKNTAEVTLLTDKDQSIPIQIMRNGLRGDRVRRGRSRHAGPAFHGGQRRHRKRRRRGDFRPGRALSRGAAGRPGRSCRTRCQGPVRAHRADAGGRRREPHASAGAAGGGIQAARSAAASVERTGAASLREQAMSGARSLHQWVRDTFALRPTDPIDAISRGMTRREYLLRPANPLFIWFSLVVALLLNMMPWGRNPFAPDALALALVFWNVHQPRRVGMGAAFVFGLLMDVHEGALFGQHALAYTLLSYGAITMHRRIQWFPLGAQAIYVLPLLLVAQLAALTIRIWVGGEWPGWVYFAQSLVGAALWPLAAWLLLAPQRRPVDRDETRPL